MKFRVLFILFFSLILTVSSQDVDSIRVVLEINLRETDSDSQKLNVMLALGEFELDHNFTKARYTINGAFDLIEKSPTKFTNHEKALVLVQYGVLKRRLGKHSEALDSYLQALRLFQIDNDVKNIADIYHNIAMVYRFQKDYGKSIQYFKKAIHLNDSLNNKLGVGNARNMIASSYSRLKKYDSALMNYQEAERIFKSLNATENIQQLNNNMVSFYRRLGNLDKALELSLSNIKYSKSKDKKLALANSYYSISLIYEKLEEYKLAGKYVDSSIRLAKKEKFINNISKGYRKRSQLWNKLENYGAAYRDYKRYKKYSDSIYNENSVKKIQELELRYEFEKEKQEIELLTKAEASKKQLYFILFILTAIACVVIVLLVRGNYKNRAMMSKIEHENETLRLSKELEDKEINVKQLVADNTMRLAFKKDLLERIKTDSDKTDANVLLQNLTTDLRLQIESETKLSELQNKINLVNKNFDDHLKMEFPDLTKGEREVSSLLRLNLSIKEIMTIRNVSEDSVKSMRRRIRKKMSVPKSQSIEDFIQSLA
ncbi:MAG: tetratricopeptide repeat protein [Winogradskyella sp.]|nr:MAG: tetratricopeptide repeat protein [Winogradskyella sp.]